MVLRSLAVFERFGEAVGGEAGFVRTGALIGVSPSMRPTLERTLALQKGIGIQAEIVDPADLARIEPRIDTSGLGAVLWEPGSGLRRSQRGDRGLRRRGAPPRRGDRAGRRGDRDSPP